MDINIKTIKPIFICKGECIKCNDKPCMLI